MWKATLSDGSQFEQTSDVGEWRKLVGKCIAEGLHLTSFTYNDEEVDPRGQSCFIVYDAVGSMKQGMVRARVGIGTFRSNGKGHISWKTQVGNPEYGDYNEVIKPDEAAKYLDIAVERKLNEETAK